ncbi:MAG: PAS domain S-box protein, partial [Myxococcales bacterium]
VGALLDITERKLTQESLRTSEATLGVIVDELPVGIVITDAQGRVVRMNAASRQMWGITPETTSWRDYGQWVGYWPDTGERIRTEEWAMTRALLHGEVVRGELVECQQFHTGKRRLYLNNAAPVRDASGQIIGGVVAEQDVSERYAMERAVRESEARYRLLAEVAPMAVWLARSDGQVTFVNSWWVSLTGLSADASADEGWTSALQEEHRDRVTRAWRESTARGAPFELELPVRRAADGEVRWHLARALPYRGRDGAPAGWVTAAVDIHERRRDEDRVREEARRKDEFLAMLAHELRNPLAAVQSAQHLLARRLEGREGVERPLAVLERQTRALRRIVDDLLDVSRITRGMIELRREPLDLRAVVTRALDTVQDLLAQRGHRLDVALPAQPGMVVGDPVRLEQVVVNLLTNAAKYTEPGGSITLRLAEADGHLALEVADTGIGIEPALLARVFDLFEQADRDLDRTQGGLG